MRRRPNLEPVEVAARPRAPVRLLTRSHGTMPASASKPRRRASTRKGGGGGGGGVDDLISGLSDDLLLRILELLPDARDAVRTHALSRRWRGLWTGVAALRFGFLTPRRFSGAAEAERYLAFVNDTLALRATANIIDSSAVEDLAISFDISNQETGQLVPLSVEAAQGWIRYAALHEVKSFVLILKLPWRLRFPKVGSRTEARDIIIEHPVITLDDYAKMETMTLRLGGAELRLPSSTVVFSSLTDLSIRDVMVPAGGESGSLLSRLVSSACCPRLRKLRLASFKFSKEELLIDAAALSELSIDGVFGVQLILELRTPALRVLHIENCSRLNGFKVVSAPMLEDLKVWVQRHFLIDDFHGHLSSVGTLKIELFSRGTAIYDRNAGSIHLLQSCRLTRCLEVSFWAVERKSQTFDRIKGRIPPLPHVRSLSVCIKLVEQHFSATGVACLLAQCSNIEYLSIQLRYCVSSKKIHQEPEKLCDYKCHLKSDEFSLAHLQEAEFKNLIGTNCEFQFVQSILTGATGIQKVTISFHQSYWRDREVRKHAFKVMPPYH